jgi:hypothetical protein
MKKLTTLAANERGRKILKVAFTLLALAGIVMTGVAETPIVFPF